MLQDALYASAMRRAEQGTDALADPEIAKHDRASAAQRFAGEQDEFWKIADVTPAFWSAIRAPPEQRR